jgi:hypothetical protein
MHVLNEDFAGFDVCVNNSVYFTIQNRQHYFEIRYDKKINKAAIVMHRGFEKVDLVIEPRFIKIDNIDLVSRLIISGPTVNGRQDFITLPHFVTVKEFVKLALQKKK